MAEQTERQRDAETPRGWEGLAAVSAEQVRHWLDRATPNTDEASLLGEVLGGEGGLDFTRDFVDLVARPDDAFVAAVNLRSVAQAAPGGLPKPLRLAVRAGGVASMGLPWAVVPLAKRSLRRIVGHLLVCAPIPADPVDVARRPDALGRALSAAAVAGAGRTLAVLGEPVLGPDSAARRIALTRRVIGRPDVDQLCVRLGDLVPNLSEWGIDADAARLVEALRPLLLDAIATGTRITLEGNAYREHRLVPTVLALALADPELAEADLGVTVQAALPESSAVLARLTRWSQDRVARGLRPVHVRLVKGDLVGRETVASILSGLPVPVLPSKRDTDAQFKRLIDAALTPDAVLAVRPVIASNNLFDLAFAQELALRRGLEGAFGAEVLLGVSPGQAAAVAETIDDVRVFTPVVRPKDFEFAIDYLLDRVEDAANPESYLSAVSEIAHDPSTFETERARFSSALSLAEGGLGSGSHRLQHRAREWDPSERDSALFYRPPAEERRFDTGGLTAAVLGLTRGSQGEVTLEPAGVPLRVPVVAESGFANEPDTDATHAENRGWARALVTAAIASRDGADQPGEAQVSTARDASRDPAEMIEAALADGEAWRELSGSARGTVLRRAALGLVAARDRLIGVLAAETGRPIAELDREISGAVDAARFVGTLAERLDAVRGATFVPDALTAVVVDAASPIARLAEAVLSALAAGSAVLLLPDPATARTAAVFVEELEAASLPPGLIRLALEPADSPVGPDAESLAERFAADSRVDRMLLLTDRARARAVVRRRPDLRVHAQLTAVGSLVVTPNADLADAARDVAASAFRGAGSDPSGIQLVLLVGSVGRSKRFQRLLRDAVRALRAEAEDPLSVDLGPLSRPASGDARRALVDLDAGESWLLAPEPLDDSGRLWSPGIRLGVRRDSWFATTPVQAPVIGVMTAHTLSEALQMQAGPASGAVAGLHSLDADEIAVWVDQAPAASLHVNRATVEHRIGRQAFGGWGDAGMGLQPLSGGPNRLITLGSWRLREGTQSSTLHLRGLEDDVAQLIETAQASLSYEDFDLVRRAALSDQLSWAERYGAVRDTMGLGIERNLLRYWPVSTQIRLAEGGSLAELLRVLAAALLARAPISVSTGQVLPPEVQQFLQVRFVSVSLERDADWLERLAAAGLEEERIRLIGGDRVRAAEWLGGLDRTGLWAEPVTMAGPVELLSLLREQSVSIAAHRRGVATTLTDALF